MSEAVHRDDIDAALHEVRCELFVALRAWPAHNSAHESYAVLLEEVQELWAHVKMKQHKRCLTDMRMEALQVAAMALRFAIEVCGEERGRR